LTFTIRKAQRQDAPAILHLIRELAEYERLRDHVECDEARIVAAFFAAEPKVFCDLADEAGAPVGSAIWFYSYSTFTGRHGIYLEDLYVEPAHRRSGIGRALLRHLAQRCIAEHLTRLEWSVLDWNEPSIGFYRSLGAVPMDEWTRFRLAGDALAALGSGKSQVRNA
jgi:GNAT superfamily N-acetyltransferase